MLRLVRYVFMIHRGDPIAPAELERIPRMLGNRAGVRHCHPNRFRHTPARVSLRNGGDAFALQQMLGHESLETRRNYAELEREDVEKEHKRASPVDRWNPK